MSHEPNACRDHRRASPDGMALGENLVRITEPWVQHLADDGEPDDPKEDACS